MKLRLVGALWALGVTSSAFAQSADPPAEGIRPIIVYGETSVCERYRVLFRHDRDWFVRCETSVLSNEAELMREARVLQRGAIPRREPFLLARIGLSWLLFDVARDGALELPEDLDAQRALLRQLSGPAPVARTTTTNTAVETPESQDRSAASTTARATGDDIWDQAWPYVVAGVLLAGATTFIVVMATQRSDPTPTLRVETVPLVVSPPLRF